MQAYAARTGERSLPHPARPINQHAPRARLRLERFGNLFQFFRAPEERLQARQIVRNVRLEHGRIGGNGLCVIVLRVAFVEGEAFENQRSGLLRRFVVEFDKGRRIKESVYGRILKPSEHDPTAFAFGQLGKDRHPFPACPLLLIVVRADDGHDQISLLAIKLRQINAEIVAGELSFVEFVVEDFLCAELFCEQGGDLGDKVALFTGKREGNAKAFRVHIENPKNANLLMLLSRSDEAAALRR